MATTSLDPAAAPVRRVALAGLIAVFTAGAGSAQGSTDRSAPQDPLQEAIRTRLDVPDGLMAAPGSDGATHRHPVDVRASMRPAPGRTTYPSAPPPTASSSASPGITLVNATR